MNRLKSRSTSPPPAEPPSPAAANTAARLRRVHRAASDLRRGIPVVLTAGGTMIAMLAAEAADADNVAELAALAVDAPLLLLAPTRAAAVLRRPVAHGEVGGRACGVPESLLVPESLRAMAEPAAQPVPPERLGEPVPLPPMAGAALGLGKLALLLPAVLVAVLRPGLREELDRRRSDGAASRRRRRIPGGRRRRTAPGRRRPRAVGGRA